MSQIKKEISVLGIRKASSGVPRESVEPADFRTDSVDARRLLVHKIWQPDVFAAEMVAANARKHFALTKAQRRMVQAVRIWRLIV